VRSRCVGTGPQSSDWITETELLDVKLAAMLARYDREVAQVLLEPYLPRPIEFYAPQTSGSRALGGPGHCRSPKGREDSRRHTTRAQQSRHHHATHNSAIP